MVIVLLLSALYVFYQRNQPPEVKDILYSERADSITVLTIEKIAGEWSFLYYNQSQKIHLGFLEQNILGNWKIKGIVETARQRGEHDQEKIELGYTGTSNPQVCYYYGMISNQEVDTVRLSVEHGPYKELQLEDANDRRYFLESLFNEDDCVPYHYEAISKDGELIAEEG
ncbi:hypothetical protein [Aquibacillus rhizosphaerae]|uniref:DUF4944 domain-containing protein n=1 Tax=Aquibacillus rhizosphaerae TaxID=3051431 RepID=A0ABT7L114_9BACI|nr:hypothetical protein [Aquibacillus sp. LR5S19]MDL4839488.1 hypothetical protein [Aquibacillus sp. LR5S19]